MKSRHATPYHAPLYLAQAKGFFKDEDLKVALLEPNDPSDVTEIIGSGKVDMGFKAMIHTLAVRVFGPGLNDTLLTENRPKLVASPLLRLALCSTSLSPVSST